MYLIQVLIQKVSGRPSQLQIKQDVLLRKLSHYLEAILLNTKAAATYSEAGLQTSIQTVILREIRLQV